MDRTSRESFINLGGKERIAALALVAGFAVTGACKAEVADESESRVIAQQTVAEQAIGQEAPQEVVMSELKDTFTQVYEMSENAAAVDKVGNSTYFEATQELPDGTKLQVAAITPGDSPTVESASHIQLRRYSDTVPAGKTSMATPESADGYVFGEVQMNTEGAGVEFVGFSDEGGFFSTAELVGDDAQLEQMYESAHNAIQQITSVQ